MTNEDDVRNDRGMKMISNGCDNQPDEDEG